MLVWVAFGTEGPDWGAVERLGEGLAARIELAGVGEFDGEEVGEDGARLYCYGPDADRLWAAVEGVVDLGSRPPGSHAVLRYGPPGAAEARIERP